MSEINITVEGGTSKRLLTAGKYCDRDIIVTAAGGGDSLPGGYKRADYITFTGNQLIDTGVIGTQDTKIQVCFTRETSAQRYLYGCAHAANTAAVTAYLGGSWRFGNKNATKPIGTIDADLGHFGLVDKTTISVTGSISTISDVNDFETIGTILLGGCRSSDGSLSSIGHVGKVLFFAMRQGEEQVLKLVPAVSAEGVYRFYDEVSGNFFDSITEAPLEGGNW